MMTVEIIKVDSETFLSVDGEKENIYPKTFFNLSSIYLIHVLPQDLLKSSRRYGIEIRSHGGTVSVYDQDAKDLLTLLGIKP